jgi:hypothetical protein
MFALSPRRSEYRIKWKLVSAGEPAQTTFDECTSYGSHDWSYVGERLIDVVDSAGRVHHAEPGLEGLSEICPGVDMRTVQSETRQGAGRGRECIETTARVQPWACPVTLRIQHVSRYESHHYCDYAASCYGIRVVTGRAGARAGLRPTRHWWSPRDWVEVLRSVLARRS